MKKSFLIVLLLLCVSFAFAGAFKPYLLTLDLHPAILGGWCPTYIGLGVDYGMPLSNGDTAHVNVSGAGGITERGLFLNPKTGSYLKFEDDIELMDIVSFEWDIKGIYDLGDSFKFTAGYKGIYELREDSMLYTGKYWPKKQATERWLGGAEKRNLTTSIDEWLTNHSADRNTSVYPELANDYSVFNTIHAEAEFNRMTDTMVANDGYLALLKLSYVPGFLNKDANLFYANFDFIAAKKLIDTHFDNGLTKFALSIIDRVDINYTNGTEVPTYFQQSVSLGRKVRGFNEGSYPTVFTAVNNFEVRLAGLEFLHGVFLRTNFFFDCGIGAGKIFNADPLTTKPFNILASVGVQEQIDYQDAFDLGIQVAYLLKGENIRHPYSPIQVSATFFLDF